MQFPFHFPAVTLIVYNKRTTAEHREAEPGKKSTKNTLEKHTLK